MLGISLIPVGDFENARDHLQAALALDDFGFAPFSNLLAWGAPLAVRSSALHNLHNCLFLLGWPAQAEAATRQGSTEISTISHLYARALALNAACRAHALRHDAHRLAATAAELLEISGKNSYSHLEATGQVFQGWALALSGKHHEAIAMIAPGVARCRAMGFLSLSSLHLAMLAECHAAEGDFKSAMLLLVQATDFAMENGEYFWEAELHRLKGEFHLDADHDLQEAESCFLRALDAAQRQNARLLELRALTSLARLWAGLGKQRVAQTRLATAYGWFTEGFETDDLRNAKAVLDTLQ